MTTISDIYIPADEYVNINTLSGISAGTSVILINKGAEGIFIQDSTTQPIPGSSDGIPLATFPYATSAVSVDSPDNSLWLRSSGPNGSKVNIQEA